MKRIKSTVLKNVFLLSNSFIYDTFSFPFITLSKTAITAITKRIWITELMSKA